jgi:MFS family permease
MALVALAVMLAGVGVTAPVSAYDPLTWRSIDGGGAAFVSAGSFTLGGTIGQPDAGTLAAGAYSLRGGFWIGGSPGAVGVSETPPRVLSFRLFPTRPNPVRARSRAAFDLPRASRVALSLFDVSGRVAHRWELGLLPAGHQELEWSAVDDRGRSLSNGIYFLRLDTEREQAVNKVLVVR